MKLKTLISWSSGKDSAWALYKLQQDPEIELAGLFCTVNKKFNRVAMHGVRIDLLKKQAECIGLPLEIIELSDPCSHDDYEKIMHEFVYKAQLNEIKYFAFGDLFLEDVRKYREAKLKATGIKPLFPIWGLSTDQLAKDMIDNGLQAIITCVDPKQLTKDFAGRKFDYKFLSDLPESVDSCGENGEFHTFVYNGPMFKQSIDIVAGEVVEKDGFVFTDVLAK